MYLMQLVISKASSWESNLVDEILKEKIFATTNGLLTIFRVILNRPKYFQLNPRNIINNLSPIPHVYVNNLSNQRCFIKVVLTNSNNQ